MADWKQLHPAITAIVPKLPRNAYLALRNSVCLMQFASTAGTSGAVYRAEVCRDVPDDEPRLREKGWELVDSWSGLWRRDIPATSEETAVSGLVLEAINALRLSFGIRDPEGFTYLSWQETATKAGWQIWKSAEDRDLKWPDLGLPRGKDKLD